MKYVRLSFYGSKLVEWYFPGCVSDDLIFPSARDLIITVKAHLFSCETLLRVEWTVFLPSPVSFDEEQEAPMSLVIRLLLQRGYWKSWEWKPGILVFFSPVLDTNSAFIVLVIWVHRWLYWPPTLFFFFIFSV